MDRLEQEGLAGQILIAQGERMLLARSLGTLHPDQAAPVRMDSVMPLASISKAFTASALLALAADGRVDLDDPIGQHLDGLSAVWRDLPLRHLATHSAGLAAEIFNPAWPGAPRFEPISREELVRRVNQFPPDAQAGTSFNYSNVGYNLIAAVVESISDQTLEQFLRGRLLEPAGIDGIGLLLADWPESALVTGRYGAAASGHHLLQPRLAEGLGWHSRGSGDLLARPADMMTWWQSLRAHSWLPQPWMTTFLTPQLAQADGSYYGFGLEFRSGPLGPEIGHTGSDLDFTAIWTWFVDADLMIYVALADSRWRADRISDTLLAHLKKQFQVTPP
ncbi:MAG: serine hydrolase domain-containing protein [Wenzhouxiangella sp.]